MGPVPAERAGARQIAVNGDFVLEAADQGREPALVGHNPRHGFPVPGNRQARGIQMVEQRQAFLLELRCADGLHVSISELKATAAYRRA